MTLFYILMATAILSLLLVLSPRLARAVRIAAGVTAAIFLIVIIVMTIQPPVYLGPSHWYNESPFKEGVSFVIMLLGMAARTLSVAIEQRDRTKGGSLRGLNVDLWDFVYPFLISFITFGAVESQIGSSDLSLSNLVFSFQNGFFWQTLIKSIKGPPQS